MKCPKCGGEFQMTTGVLITCFYCGKSLYYPPDDLQVPKEMQKSPDSHSDYLKTSKSWIRKRQAAARRHERVLASLKKQVPRYLIARENKCSVFLVNQIARNNGIQVYGKASPNGRYIGRASRRSGPRVMPPRQPARSTSELPN